MKGEWFCYKGSLFNEGGMIMLERWAEWSYYGGGQFKGGRMVMLRKWSV